RHDDPRDDRLGREGAGALHRRDDGPLRPRSALPEARDRGRVCRQHRAARDPAGQARRRAQHLPRARQVEDRDRRGARRDHTGSRPVSGAPKLPWVAVLLAVLLYVGWAIWPASALYNDVLSAHRMLAIAAAFKLAALLLGSIWAFACRDRLETDNPARPAWFLLSLGLLSTFAGQASLAPFQLVLGETPFPTPGDIFYVLAYPFLIAALLVFLNAYREAGMPLGSAPA